MGDKIQNIRNNLRDIISPWTFEVKTSEMVYQEKPDYFRFKSHGFSVHPPDNVTETAIFHFTPNDIRNIDEVPNSERFQTSRMVFEELLLALMQFEEFIENNKHTHLAKINHFEGVTNERFAKFLEKYFGMEIFILQNFDKNGNEIDNDDENDPVARARRRYKVGVSMKVLLARIKEFKKSHSRLMRGSKDTK
jgi:hypothetical protein